MELAEGRVNVVAKSHVDSCADCARALDQLRAMMAAGQTEMTDAPMSLIERAKAIVAPQQRRLLAGILRTSLAAGARSVGTDFQVVVGSEDVSARLMYSKEADGWVVMGRAPSNDWTMIHGSEQVPCEPDGRFSFRAPSLSDTGFALMSTSAQLIVPPIEDLLENGS